MLVYTEYMNNPIIYVVLNKELKMSPGKAAAQAVHAAMLLEGNYDNLFASSYKRTVIVLEGTGEQIKNLHIYLQEAGIFSDYYIDEGKNEVDAYSVTALAVEPIDGEDREKRDIFADFDLFGYGNGFLDRVKASMHG